MKISFLGPVPPGAELTCTAEVVSGGRRVAFVEAGIVARVPGDDAGATGGPGVVDLHVQGPQTDAGRLRCLHADGPGPGLCATWHHGQTTAATGCATPGRRLPAHGRLPQAGDDRPAQGARPLPLHGDRRLVLLGLRHPVDPPRGAAPAADRDGHGPDRGLVVGALRRRSSCSASPSSASRRWRITAGPGQQKLPEVVARREARETDSREEAS